MNAGIGEYAMRRSALTKPKVNTQYRNKEATIGIEMKRYQTNRSWHFRARLLLYPIA
jgi:hypothetical protein